ncbi:MAG: ABC transporter ATP-binding protein [Deltaproteobacteria bacterium]|nr:ABC transporter ATP-binding protein [Deltaproteobacteria bacterium]MBW2414088.1 ABC transporter ATP-binding protein [Deltaproteobacteria bacterium]
MRVEVRGLARSFGSVEALCGLDFTIEPGERVALIGPNGSGKSTLTRALMGLIGFRGEVRLDGSCPLRERIRVARQLAYVPQIAPRLAAPVGELLRAVRSVRGETLSGVDDLARRFDLDLDALASRPFSALSGGMKQKLLLALALGSRASLLILDEPIGSLDAESRERFYELIRDLPEDVTLLLCSHRLEEQAALVQRAIALEEGRQRFDGPAGDLRVARV